METVGIPELLFAAGLILWTIGNLIYGLLNPIPSYYTEKRGGSWCIMRRTGRHEEIARSGLTAEQAWQFEQDKETTCVYDYKWGLVDD